MTFNFRKSAKQSLLNIGGKQHNKYSMHAETMLHMTLSETCMTKKLNRRCMNFKINQQNGFSLAIFFIQNKLNDSGT